MITIKQLADKLDVSKPTITRNKPANMSFHIENNTYLIDEELEKQITANVLKNKQRYSTNTEDETGTDTLTQHLMQENEFLRAQIVEKDSLIKEQTKLLDQQQKLNLITSKKIESLENNTETETKQEETHSETRSDSDNSFFKKLFKR